MTQHFLQGRTEQEVLWFQRRSFLQAAAAWAGLGGFTAAQAQYRSNIFDLRGDGEIAPHRETAASALLDLLGDAVDAAPPRFQLLRRQVG